MKTQQPNGVKTYYPFGAWRTTPTQTLTDRGYTGASREEGAGLCLRSGRFTDWTVFHSSG